MKNDIQIQQDVIEQLRWEPFLDAAEIGVTVKNGIVTLSGNVDMYYKKIAAEGAAKKVAGVKAVAENIQVGILPSYRKTDTEIAEAVTNALRWNISVPDENIKIKVEDGVVSLDGEVDWHYQRNAARNTVEKLAGVRRINNNITIKPAITAADVKKKISAAFVRYATIDAGKITVDVIDNRVILAGKVRSFADREDAENAAWSAPGVTSVENRLELQEEEYAF